MNNLPIESKKENIFTRFFKFVKGIFKKENEIEHESIKNNTVEEVAKVDNIYKVDNIEEKDAEVTKKYNQERTLEEIIEIIEKEPSTLEKLDIKKLEVIDQYYKDKIEEYKKKLAM